MCWLLILVVCISFGVCNSEEESSILARIPDIIEDFCPGVNVCRENQSTQVPEKTFEPGFGSCCTECSCSMDCADNGNCCFPYKLPYRHDDHNGLNILQNGRDCLLPTTVKPQEEDRISYQSYYMVSAVPENETCYDNRKMELKISCGDVNVAPWGSLYPVYSAKYKQIYKNMACATAHGVTDGILWDAVLTCDTDILYQTDASTSVLGLDSNSTPGYCSVYFSYPGDRDHLQALKCCVSPIDTCPDTEFQIPDGTGVSKEDIIELCTCGFLSPYRVHELYANVFCQICNGYVFKKEIYCPEVSHTSRRGPYQRGFVGLIDQAFIRSGSNLKFETLPEIPMACDFKDTSRCYPVLCPSGQLRDKTGKCKYPNKIWYDQEYTVFINLTSQEAINITEVFHHVKFGNDNTLHSLKSPWPRNWLTGGIYNKIDARKNKNTHLIVTLKTKISRIRPQYFVQNLKRLFMQEWMMEYNNATIVLKSFFLASSLVNLDLDSDKEAVIAFGNNSKNVTIPKYSRVYNSLNVRGNTHLITKLYFCYQVELIQPDFILSTDQRLIFNTATQRFMFDGEFVLIPSDSNDGVRARICIEDSGMYKIDNDATKNTGVFHEICILRFTIIALFLGLHTGVFSGGLKVYNCVYLLVP